jgi:hypothetical protein
MIEDRVLEALIRPRRDGKINRVKVTIVLME